MAQSYPDNEQQSGPWRGPRGITRDEAEDLSKQLKPRWERPRARLDAEAAESPETAGSRNGAPLSAKKTLLGMNVPDEATTSFEASKAVVGSTSGKPRLKATVAGMPAVNPAGADVGDRGRKHTVMGIPAPVEADAKLSKATMVGIPVPTEARKTSKQTNVGIPVTGGAADNDLKKKTDDAEMSSPNKATADDTMSDVVAPSTPFPPAVDSVPAKPFGATVRVTTPLEVISAREAETASATSASKKTTATRTTPAVEHDDDVLAALGTGAQPGAGKKKAVFAALGALAAVILLGLLFSGGDDAEPEANAKAPAAAPQLVEQPKPKSTKEASAPKPPEERAEVQPAKVVEATPTPAPPAKKTPTSPKASAPTTPKPKPKAVTRIKPTPRSRKPSGRSSGSLPDVKRSAASKGALLRDPAAKRRPSKPKTKPTATPARAASPKPKPKPKKSRGTIVRDTPF